MLGMILHPTPFTVQLSVCLGGKLLLKHTVLHLHGLKYSRAVDLPTCVNWHYNYL